MAPTESVAEHRAIELRVPVAQADQNWEIAASVYVPRDGVPAAAAVLVLLPGGGYGRRYFDLPDPSHSQVAHHVGRGTIVVALDHLGSGESTSPPMEVSTLPAVAAANHAAVTTILDRLRTGTLAPGELPAIAPTAVVGAGQSMGGHVVVGMQAHHRTFDAVALLGCSVVGTTFPRRGETDSTVSYAARDEIDWPWVFHWVEEPSPLATTDIEAGIPMKTEALPWASATVPGLATALVEPGAIAAEAASIDVPVLLVAGERDVTRPLLTEAAAFSAATDLAVFRLHRMAHMHNFAPTRHLLWERLDAFVCQATN